MRFILQYPDFHGTGGDMLDAGPVGELAQLAERHGWSGFAFTEHPAPTERWLNAGGHQSLDPFAALAHVAAVTQRLTLLTYLAVLPYRNPLSLAKSAATVDKLSNGRFVLGAGTGYLKAEYFALGVDFDERNALFDEALDVMPMYWKGDAFDYQGRHFNARGTIGRPRPVQDPIPIWIGGNAKLTLRRVGERAHGWMPLFATPREFFTTVRSAEVSSIGDLAERISMLRDYAGDRFDEITIAMSYNDDDRHLVSARAEEVGDRFGRLAELGVTCVVVPGPVVPAPGSAEFIEAFAAEHIAEER